MSPSFGSGSVDVLMTSRSAYFGVSVAVADGADLYGEISGITAEDDVDWSAKAGVKFTF